MRAAAAAAAVAAVATLLLAACSTTSGQGSGSAPPSSAGTSTSSSPDFPSAATTVTKTATASNQAQPSVTQRAAQLTAQTNGQPHVIVAVPSGYQAAVFDQGGDIYFWFDDASTTSWRQIGQSKYPYDSRNGAPHAKVIGALLHGMSDATFIARGVFTGDGSGNAVAFTTGTSGWGAIKAESDGNIGPSGAPVNPSNQIGLSYGFAFSNGDLVTEDCPTNRPIYQCGSHPVRKVWRWTGHDFATG